MDARFYRETLAERVREIGKSRDSIHVTNDDALNFLKHYLEGEANQQISFIYLDPPYYSNSKRLYMNVYEDTDHEQLAEFMQRHVDRDWLMSYDDDPFIVNLYEACEVTKLTLAYSLQRKRESQEVLIRPPGVEIPPLG